MAGVFWTKKQLKELQKHFWLFCAVTLQMRPKCVPLAKKQKTRRRGLLVII